MQRSLRFELEEALDPGRPVEKGGVQVVGDLDVVGVYGPGSHAMAPSTGPDVQATRHDDSDWARTPGWYWGSVHMNEEEDPIETLTALTQPLGAKQLYESRTLLIMGEITSMVAERVTRMRELAAEAVYIMEQYKITPLPVADEHGKLVGALNVHDLFRAGVV